MVSRCLYLASEIRHQTPFHSLLDSRESPPPASPRTQQQVDAVPPSTDPQENGTSGQPPSYSSVTPSTHTPLTDKRQNFIEHIYPIGDGKKTWATLRIYSRALNANHRPLFYPGDHVTGFFDVDLEKAETINLVVLSVSPDFSLALLSR